MNPPAPTENRNLPDVLGVSLDPGEIFLSVKAPISDQQDAKKGERSKRTKTEQPKASPRPVASKRRLLIGGIAALVSLIAISSFIIILLKNGNQTLAVHVDDDWLREHSPVPIAGGEVLTRRQAFQPWLEARAFDIVQPDVTKVGGISEERRIGWMAQEHGVRFIPHGWNTAVGLAADLHLASAFPGTDLVEYLTGSPFIDEITIGGWKLDADGMLSIPDEPGLGLKLDPDVVKKYTGIDNLLS